MHYESLAQGGETMKQVWKKLKETISAAIWTIVIFLPLIIIAMCVILKIYVLLRHGNLSITEVPVWTLPLLGGK